MIPAPIKDSALTARLRTAVAQLPAMRGYQETNERVSMESLGLEHPERVNYSASPWWTLRWLLRTGHVSSSDVFLEYGCGKGRVVLDAARRYRFKRVVGVELAPELTAVASELVARERDGLRCRDVIIETADATLFEVPDDVTFVYFYNPFGGAIFARVVENLVASLDRAPRELRIIYLNPVEEQMLISTGRFRRVREARLPRFVDRPGAAIYVST
jgi:SAM-dependent methyltransferase